MAYVAALFAELQRLIPGYVFEKLERKFKIGIASRKFGFKEQFTVISFFMLAACCAMREGIRNLDGFSKRLYHWGLKNVCRSTFSNAMKNRPAAFLNPHPPKDENCYENSLLALCA